MNKKSPPYRALCTEFYDFDKPFTPDAREANGPILEPMCGTGHFLIPLLEKRYSVSGFDYSFHMLEVCGKKCTERNLKPALTEATFKTFSS